MNPADVERVEAAVRRGAVAEAIAILESYTDLRAADLPALSKAALKDLAGHEAAVLELTQASVHPSSSVRRFVRKYLPKAGPHAAPAMLRTAVGCLDPMKPGTACDGFTNPLGAAIARQRLSFDPPKPPYNYSQAEKFARDVLENVLFLLASVSPPLFVRFREYSEALQPNFRYAEPVDLGRDWPHSELFLPGTANWESGVLLGKCASLIEAIPVWADLRLLLDEPQADPVAEELRQRCLELPEVSRENARRSLRLDAARWIGSVPREQRGPLVPWLDARRKSPYSVDDSFYSKYLDDFLTKNPPEASPDPTLPAQPDPAEASAPLANCLVALLDLAGELGLKALRSEMLQAIGPERTEYLGFEEKPGGRWQAEPGDEALLESVLATVGVGTKPLYQERVPELKLRGAVWQPRLADLLLRLAGPELEAFRGLAPDGWEWQPFGDESEVNRRYWYLRQLNGFAYALLDEAGLDRWGERLGGVAFDWDVVRDMLNILEERALRPIRLLGAMRCRSTQALGDQAFQAALGRLYSRPEPAAHAAALALVAAIQLPRGGEYYKRNACNDPYRWVCWAAWQRQDADLLAAALERCALSYHTKGKPTVPEAPAHLALDTYAPSQREGKGVALEEVWRLVRRAHPERVPRILQSLLSVAEHEDLPRVMLRVAAAVEPADLDAVREQVLEMLESSQAPVVGAALEALRRRPGLAGEEVFETVARSLASPSPGVAKEAAATVGALGAAHPALKERAQAALLEALGFDTATVLEQVLKSLKDVRTGPLDGGAEERLRELAARDAKRFDRLAQQLLR